MIIIISYLFNFISKKSKIPSVLLLIGLGVGLQYLLELVEINLDNIIMSALELLGVVGLIMIVLEAALDLKLEKDKKTLTYSILHHCIGGTHRHCTIGSIHFQSCPF